MSIPDAITEYLSSISASKTVMGRVEELLVVLNDVLPANMAVSQAFLSTYVDSDGGTNYDNAWFFAGDRAFEIGNFLRQEEFRFDCTFIERSIRRWEINTTKFNPIAGASVASRIVLTIQFGVEGLGGLAGEFKASGKNCDHLYALLKRIVVPNLAGRN
jgi:hypothetical protein